MIGLGENELLIRCTCHSAAHRAMLIHDVDPEHGDDWYLSFVLNNFGFLKRVRMAFRYIFAPLTIKYGTTGEIVLRDEDVDQIAVFIQKRRALASGDGA